MSKTLFEKIAAREIPAQIVFEDDLVLAIRDIQPQAPTHIILFPKRAVPHIAEVPPADGPLLGHLLLTAAKIAQQEHLKNGFRLVINNGADGGETVPHLHVHILGGRVLGWPPG